MDENLKNEKTYDRVFWTTIEKLKRFIIPLINEAFDDNIPEDAEINEQKPSLRAMNYIISQNPSLSVEDYLFVGDRNDRDGASAQLVNMDYCDIKQFISVIKNAEKSEK